MKAMHHTVLSALCTGLLLLLAGCTPLLESSVRGLSEGLRSPARVLMAAAPAQATELLYVEIPAESRAAVHVPVDAPGQPGVRWWAAPDGVTIITQAGRVQATDGLPGDLLATRWRDAPSDWALGALDAARLIKQRDAYQGAVADTEHVYRFARQRDRVMVWGGQHKALLRVEERPEKMAKGSLAWPGDRAWLDPDTGLVYRWEVYYRPDRVMILLPRTPWAWSDPAVAVFARRLPVMTEADPLTLRLRMDGRLRLHEAMARLPLPPDPLGVRLLLRERVSAQRVEQQLLLASLHAVSDTKLSKWPGLQAWRQAVADAPINGLTPLPAITAVRTELLPTRNVWLQAGDRVVLGHRQRHVTIWDPRSLTPCVKDYTPWRTVSNYLHACLQDLDLPDHVWLAGPEGNVRRLGVAAWNQDADVWPAPGSAIVVDDRVLSSAAAQPDLAEQFARVVVRAFEGGAAP